jgi:hypothetical protein
MFGVGSVCGDLRFSGHDLECSFVREFGFGAYGRADGIDVRR